MGQAFFQILKLDTYVIIFDIALQSTTLLDRTGGPPVVVIRICLEFDYWIKWLGPTGLYHTFWALDNWTRYRMDRSLKEASQSICQMPCSNATKILTTLQVQRRIDGERGIMVILNTTEVFITKVEVDIQLWCYSLLVYSSLSIVSPKKKKKVFVTYTYNIRIQYHHHHHHHHLIMWRLKLSEGNNDPWVKSVNNHIGRQYWEFDPNYFGTHQDRAQVEQVRHHFHQNRFITKHSSDLLMRLQVLLLRVLIIIIYIPYLTT